MTRVAQALLTLVLLAAAGESLADSPAVVTPRPPPSSYAPGPRTHQHVYGSPIEPRHAGAARSPRTKAPTKYSKAGPAHNAHHHATKGQQPAPAPAPA